MYRNFLLRSMLKELASIFSRIKSFANMIVFNSDLKKSIIGYCENILMKSFLVKTAFVGTKSNSCQFFR